MNLDSMSFFSLASRRMEWLGARQKVIAENVANSDTPGFQARDVVPFEEMLASEAEASGMSVTEAGHMSGSDGTGPAVRVDEDAKAWAKSIDGNSVVLEQQAINANEVSESYRLAANLYRKGYELLTLSVTGIR